MIDTITPSLGAHNPGYAETALFLHFHISIKPWSSFAVADDILGLSFPIQKLLGGDVGFDTQWTVKLYHLYIVYFKTQFVKQSIRWCYWYCTASMIFLRLLTSQMTTCHACHIKTAEKKTYRNVPSCGAIYAVNVSWLGRHAFVKLLWEQNLH